MAASISTRNGRTALTAETSNRSGAELVSASALAVWPIRLASVVNATKPSRQITCIIDVAPLPNAFATSQSGGHRAQSVDVIALVGSILVIGKAFLLGDAATANDACLQLGDHGVHVTGG